MLWWLKPALRAVQVFAALQKSRVEALLVLNSGTECTLKDGSSAARAVTEAPGAQRRVLEFCSFVTSELFATMVRVPTAQNTFTQQPNRPDHPKTLSKCSTKHHTQYFWRTRSLRVHRSGLRKPTKVAIWI